MSVNQDGKVEAQMSIAAQSKENEDNDCKFRIGRHDQHGGFYQGLIDEVALFNTALTEEDINKIMTGGLERSVGLTAVSPKGNLTTTWGEIKE